MKAPKGIWAALASILALAVSACDQRPPDAEQEVRSVVEEALTTTDPGACESITTTGFRLEAYGFADNADALEACELQVSSGAESAAESVQMPVVDVTDSRATVVATVTGGDADGQRLTYRLVEAQGRWRIDQVVGLKLDHDQVARSTDRVLAQLGSVGVRGSVGECVAKRLGRRIAASAIVGLHGGKVAPNLNDRLDAVVAQCRGAREGVAPGVEVSPGP